MITKRCVFKCHADIYIGSALDIVSFIYSTKSLTGVFVVCVCVCLMATTARKRKRNQLADELLLNTLTEYYTTHPAIYDQLYAIVHSRSRDSPSLRTVEFGVTNRSRSHNTAFLKHENNGEIQWLIIHNWYKNCLGDYNKRYFDPFRRTNKIIFCTPNRKDRPFETTLAQLTFARKIFSSGIMDKLYTDESRSQMEKEMAQSLAAQRHRKTQKRAKKKRRYQQSIFPGKQVRLLWK